MAQTTLFTRAQIDERVAEMGRKISDDFARNGTHRALRAQRGGVLLHRSGAHIDLDVALDFIQVSSYGNQKYSSGVVTILKEPQLDMHGKIGADRRGHHRQRPVDARGASATSKAAARRWCKTATFLDKPAARKVDFTADYVGFSIDPKFVIGYGLDFAEKYRNIPEVQVLSD